MIYLQRVIQEPCGNLKMGHLAVYHNAKVIITLQNNHGKKQLRVTNCPQSL